MSGRTLRSQAAVTEEEVLKHFAESLSGFSNEFAQRFLSGLEKSDGVTTITGFLAYDEDDFRDIYTDEPQNPKDGESPAVKTKIMKAQFHRCLGYKIYTHFLADTQGQAASLELIDQMSLTKDDLDEFMRSGIYTDLRSGNPTHSVSRGTTAVSTAADPVKEFKKGNKRDASAYDVLKSEWQMDAWKCATIATADLHDTANVLKSTYVPSTNMDKEMFKEQKKFMYNVFNKTLKTDYGKFLVNEHSDDRDSQEIWKKLMDHASKSTKAAIDSIELLEYITSTRYDRSFKGSAHSYILHWREKLRLFQEMVKKTDRFSENMKMTMLQQAVSSLPELDSVKQTLQTDYVNHGTAPDYQNYVKLLLSKASAYDAQFARKKFTGSRRAVNVHEFVPTDTDDDNFSPVDTVSPFSTQDVNELRQFLDIYAARTSMPKERWDSLTPETQAIWDTLDSRSKSVILGYADPSSSQSDFRRRPPRGPPTPTSTRTAKMTSMSDVELYRLMQATSTRQDGTATKDGDNSEFHDALTHTEEPSPTEADLRWASENPIMSFLTSQTSRLDPADLRRVLSTTRTPGTPTPPSQPSGGARSGTNNGSKSDSSSRLQVKMANVTYHVSTNNHQVRHERDSLVDRGANGGLAGADVRVIATTTRSVDIQGIDGHEVQDVPIGTVGAVAQTQHGPVIVIMHQYAITGKGHTIHSSGQLEHFKNEVNDRSMMVPGGKQRILTIDGYAFPLNIEEGLPRLPLMPYTDEQ